LPGQANCCLQTTQQATVNAGQLNWLAAVKEQPPTITLPSVKCKRSDLEGKARGATKNL